MSVKHRHHIVPKHAGGTNVPSNIVLLTIEEHAEAHWLLWVEFGRWQDEIAWRMLAGLIPFEEARRLTAIKFNTGRVVSEETRRKTSLALMGRSTGPHSEEWKAKIAASLIKAELKMSEETKKKLIAANTGRPMAAWHKAKLLAVNTSRQYAPHTEETKQKIREARARQAPMSEDGRRRVSIRHTGKTVSPETRARLSAAHKWTFFAKGILRTASVSAFP